MARVAVVTGGTRGIGAAISEALKNAGYKVVANDHPMAKDQADAFTKQTGIPAVLFDVSDFEATKTGMAEIEKAHGPVEVLVNNAGITRDGFLHKMTEKQWDEVIGVNLKSVFNTCRQVVEGMRTRGFGRIVNISSINGVAGQAGQTNYSATKAAVIGFSKALAQEGAAKGITVNVIAPGYVATEMVKKIAPEILEQIVAKIPVKRLGEVTEIARTVAFLVSDEAGFITGSTFNVNGGQYMQ